MSAACHICNGSGDEVEVRNSGTVRTKCWACNGTGGWNEIDEGVTVHTGGSPLAVALVRSAERRARGLA